MKTFNRTSLPDEIRYNNKTYFLDLDKTNSFKASCSFDAKNCVAVNVLHRNLRDKTDLHGMPYRPNKFIFSSHN